MKEIENLDEYGIFPNYAKPDCELYKDDENVVHKVIEIKKNKSKNKEEWAIIENKKIVLLLAGDKLTNKEKALLYTAKGLKAVVDAYKEGNKSFSKIKKVIHDAL